MYFASTISPTALWLIVAAAGCILLLAALYFFRIRTITEYRRKADSERPDKADADYEPASVIIYSQGNADDLSAMLDSVLSQDYPAAFEVIVVNDGESTAVRDVVSMLRPKHPNLYLTFTPEGVVNLSRKKLALTLGIKAARYDIVVLTTTDAVIESPLWLRRMASSFSPESNVEVVLGFAYIDPEEDRSLGACRRAFDFIVESVRWLGVAVAGKPFRGTEFNIAYRRSLFMRSKGFARSLNLCHGDDDIFISQIAQGNNTRVELSDESFVRIRHGNHPRLFTERVLRRIFTESFIRRRPRFLMPLTGWLQIAAFVCLAVAAWLDWPNLQTLIIGIVILLSMFALDIYVWRGVLKALRSRKLFAVIPWLSVTYPIRRIGERIHSRFGKQKKYTWD